MATGCRDGIYEYSTLFFHTPEKNIPDFFYYPLCVGHYFCIPPYRVNRSRYDSFLILYTKKGKGKVCVNGVTEELFPGDVCILDCYRPHEYFAETDWEILWLHYDGGIAREFFELLTDRTFLKISLEKTEEFERAWEKIYNHFLYQEIFRPALVSHEISGLLTDILMEKEENTGKKSRDFIDDTLQYINRHLTEELSLECLAKRVSLSPFYFSRRFKQETGYTPYHYIYTSRIHLARFYLKTSEDTVKEIGYRCGFKSEHSFCTAFKNEMGQTPTEFREG